MSIQEDWEDYMIENLPKNCSAIRKRETKKAFYTGVRTMADHMISEHTSDNDIECFLKELDEYILELKREVSQ